MSAGLLFIILLFGSLSANTRTMFGRIPGQPAAFIAIPEQPAAFAAYRLPILRAGGLPAFGRNFIQDSQPDRQAFAIIGPLQNQGNQDPIGNAFAAPILASSVAPGALQLPSPSQIGSFNAPNPGGSSPFAPPVLPSSGVTNQQVVDPVNAVPEPSTWMTMIAGLMAIGMALRSPRFRTSRLLR